MFMNNVMRTRHGLSAWVWEKVCSSLPRLIELTAARTTDYRTLANILLHITRCMGADEYTSEHSCIDDQLPVDNSGHGYGGSQCHPSLGLLSSRQPKARA